MSSAATYTCIGSVRGSCEHRHKSIATAMRCRDRDAARCAALPGGNCYSDRVIRHSDGTALDDAELDLLAHLEEVQP